MRSNNKPNILILELHFRRNNTMTETFTDKQMLHFMLKNLPADADWHGISLGAVLIMDLSDAAKAMFNSKNTKNIAIAQYCLDHFANGKDGAKAYLTTQNSHELIKNDVELANQVAYYRTKDVFNLAMQKANLVFSFDASKENLNALRQAAQNLIKA